MRLAAGLLCVVVASASPVFAQEKSWGAKVGVNLATLATDDSDVDFKFRIGVAAGGYFTLPVGSRFEIQPEALFSQQGAKAGEGDLDGAINLDTLTIPILLKFRLSPARQGLAVYGGPSIALTLRARAVSEFGDEKVDIDLSENVETTDVGIAAGAMYERGRWTLDGRYTFGLRSLAKDSEEPEIKSRVISILAGVRF